jgi:tRNA-modifying protein YgfZ
MHSFYLPPGNLDLIAVTGAGAAKLLQGQLTCDVDAVPDPGFARGALCNNKGRVFAAFVLVRHGASFYLALNQGLGDIVASVLKKYLPFYKCELRRAAADDFCIGVVGAAALTSLGLGDAPVPPQGVCAALGSGWICNLDSTQQQYLVYARETLPTGSDATAPAGTLTDWLVCGMRSGQFPFVPEDQEKFTPQEIHLDRHEYVSFTKGCYTGQEIVARMHYRGKAKKLLFRLEAPFAGTNPPGPMELFGADDAPLGSTIRVLSTSGEIHALAPLPAELQNSSPLFVKNAAGLRFSSQIF